MDYEIKKLDAVKFDLLIPLMQDCFGMDVKLDYFRWKYLQNPAGIVEGYYAVHKTSNEIAAYYGVIPQFYIVSGKKQKWYQSCDTMTHTKHRRKGLFQSLAKHCYAELSKEDDLVIIGFGGKESTPGFIKFGWEQLLHIRNYFHPTFISKLLIGLKTDSVQELSISNDTEQLVTLKSITSKIELFLDPNTIKWRLSNPLRVYKIMGIKNKESLLEAYMVYYIENNKAIILDTEHNSNINLNRLLKKIATTEKISGVLYFGQENCKKTKKLLKSFFFFNPFKKGPLSQTAPFICYTNKLIDENILKNQENWSVSPIYHDSI